MKACLTPKTIKKGDVLFSFDAFSFDDGSSTVEAHEWHVRSLRNQATWISHCGKKELMFTRQARFIGLASKKVGETFCDGKWIKNIPKAYKLNEELKDRLPEGVYTTELQAIKFAVYKWNESVKWYNKEIAKLSDETEIADYEEDLQFVKKELSLLKGRLTKIKNKQGKKLKKPRTK